MTSPSPGRNGSPQPSVTYAKGEDYSGARVYATQTNSVSYNNHPDY